MNRDFIQIKALEGELKISHKKYDSGLTVSTKELVWQKPHVNYHILLEHIFSIVPFEPPAGRAMSFHQSYSGNEIIYSGAAGLPLFKVVAHKATIYNRSGMFSLGSTQFIIPIHRDMLNAISKYSGMERIATE
ncbi:hypothetical protein [Paenibacillus thalictri]|uniref:Uncharacterized protein n=1 Tax=Paenibacillus thalictri TaxID=2527873 RepID=A0A4Q9DVQ3_9BACL|nr:hypothetical protein [Paenibacillus thalictri]TBL80364.1 hypothetical protein EYB31_08080 [Paenibacillus thalictri]